MKQFFALFLISTLFLGACSSSSRTGEDLASIVKAERGQSLTTPGCEIPSDLIGKPNSELAKMKFKAPIRVIYPGTPVTGETVANRLNFKVDKKGIIRGITCG
jgi:hypothetical protein